MKPEITETLEVFLAPGHRTRLSPLVEASQMHLLTGEWTEEKRRFESIQGIIKKKSPLIAQLAKKWVNTRQDFSAGNYEDPDYLLMYALYYFSVNVGKLQTLLFELVAKGQLPSKIHMVDFGVGTGSSLIAVLDFIYAWGLACELHDQPFPALEFSYHGLDRSNKALDISRDMVATYQEAIRRRAELFEGRSELSSSHEQVLLKVLRFSYEVIWENCDLETYHGVASQQTNLVVLSNVMNEISGTTAINQVEQYLSSLNEGAIALVLEPGDRAKTIDLMKWRTNFVIRNSSFVSIAPCGDEGGRPQLSKCSNCWSSRREAFHQPALFIAFREECRKIAGDHRSFDEHSNNLLVWSYVILKKQEISIAADAILDIKPLNPGTKVTDEVKLRILGKYYKSLEKGGRLQLVDYSSDQHADDHQSRTWNEYYLVCPSSFKGMTYLVFERRPGFQMPKIDYGQEISVKNFTVDRYEGSTNYFRLIPLDGDQTQVSLVNQSIREGDGFLSAYNASAEHTIDEIAFRLFGFGGMRQFQHQILGRVLCGRNVLGIAATGGGKSECYILPAMIMPGVTVVISPLRSLMSDQYGQRISRRFGLGDLATYINGDVPLKERQSRLMRMEMGFYKLVYFTPEQLERGYVLDSLRRTNEAVGIRYLAMDESHCISQWGHDFRPSYLNIIRRLREYGINPVIIALTATASPNVREDICTELALNPLPVDQGGDVFVYSSNRSEINLEVRIQHSTDEKISDLMDELQKFKLENQNDQNSGAAIIFMPHTGGSPESTWRYLPKKVTSAQGRNSAGVTSFASYIERQLEKKISIYHGKMENENEEEELGGEPENSQIKRLGDLSGRTREKEQDNFINSVSTGVDIMVATKGFGMGIDKPNVRLVIHRSPTQNMEAYAQESGRAGRDGEISTAILYYSPDSTIDEREADLEAKNKGYKLKVKSDHNIQEDFLSNKYVRMIDVLVMHEFLHTVQHRLPMKGVNGIGDRTYLYFTCDEAIDFFDNYGSVPNNGKAYSWPEFQQREERENEWSDHKAILDRGDLYTNKKKYLDRILAALFRIRPPLAGQKSLAYLESVQATGARLIPGKYFSINWVSIYNSNHYFGEIFRSQSVTKLEFSVALQANDLIAFAQRLNLSLKELTGMLSDIKTSEIGLNIGKSRQGILNFYRIDAPLWGPAVDKVSESAWRDYAGAYTRAIPEGKKTIDDYFPRKVLSQTKGWEVLPGPAFEKNFSEFLYAFMKVHDERKTNDLASYHGLLIDYIGVNEDGTVPPARAGKDCLRSVLLGYLETYEVVVDGNCYSCSNCVADRNYAKYSNEQREMAVTRMNPALVTSFKSLKEGGDGLPNLSVLDDFFEKMLAEERTGHSIHRYFIGWLRKLLDNEPSHQTARWLRLEGMIRTVIDPFPVLGFLDLAKALIANLPQPFLMKLLNFLKDQDSKFHANSTEYLRLCSQLSRLMHLYRDEVYYLGLMAELDDKKKPDKSTNYESSIRLVEIFSPNGPLAESESYIKWQISCARNSRDYEECLKWYSDIASKWGWNEIENEINELEHIVPNGFLIGAIISAGLSGKTNAQAEPLINWAGEHPELLKSFPIQTQRMVFSILPRDVVLASEKHLETYLVVESNADKVLAYGLSYLALDDKKTLPPLFMRKIAGHMASRDESIETILGRYVKNEDRSRHLAELLFPFAPFVSWKELIFWEKVIIKLAEVEKNKVADILISTIEGLTKSQDNLLGISEVEGLYLHLASLHDGFLEHFKKYLFPIYVHELRLMDNLLNKLANMGDFGRKLSENLLDFTLNQGNVRLLPQINCVSLSDEWENCIFLAYRLSKFVDSLSKISGSYKVENPDLIELREMFNWKRDLDQADMLASILIGLRKKIRSGWVTPLKQLVEVLILSGRSSLANQIAGTSTDLYFRKGEKILTLAEYIEINQKVERIQPIPERYLQLVKNMLENIKA